MDRRILVTFLTTILVTAIVILMSGTVIAKTPTGVNYTEVSTEETNVTHNPEAHNAFAGNVTELTIEGFSVTQHWQGYYGNITATIELADGSGSIMYNWTGMDASSGGEVYASNESSISWGNIACFNLTDDSINNKTMIETHYGMSTTDPDGINETFNLMDHAGFSTALTTFSSGECYNTQMFGASGALEFDEVLLTDSSTNKTVFASIIEDNTAGFDGNTHDFEMIVPENGTAGDTDPTTYYFYLEMGA